MSVRAGLVTVESADMSAHSKETYFAGAVRFLTMKSQIS